MHLGVMEGNFIALALLARLPFCLGKFGEFWKPGAWYVFPWALALALSPLVLIPKASSPQFCVSTMC